MAQEQLPVHVELTSDTLVHLIELSDDVTTRSGLKRDVKIGMVVSDELLHISGSSWLVKPGTHQIHLIVPFQSTSVEFKDNWIGIRQNPRTFKISFFPEMVEDRPNDSSKPLTQTVEWYAPVHGLYHLWAEIYDHRGDRYLSPTLVIRCVDQFPGHSKK
jgi:hypothetical protein